MIKKKSQKEGNKKTQSISFFFKYKTKKKEEKDRKQKQTKKYLLGLLVPSLAGAGKAWAVTMASEDFYFFLRIGSDRCAKRGKKQRKNKNKLSHQKADSKKKSGSQKPTPHPFKFSVIIILNE